MGSSYIQVILCDSSSPADGGNFFYWLSVKEYGKAFKICSIWLPGKPQDTGSQGWQIHGMLCLFEKCQILIQQKTLSAHTYKGKFGLFDLIYNVYKGNSCTQAKVRWSLEIILAIFSSYQLF